MCDCGTKWVEVVGAEPVAGVLALRRQVEHMFLGQFYHNLDEKGRITIPARFRDFLIPAGGAYVMRGFDNNLMVLPPRTFESWSHRIQQMNMTDPNVRLLRRLLYHAAEHVDVDKAGRILISQNLRQLGGLDTSVVIVGNGDFFELWSPEMWSVQNDLLQDAEANADRFASLIITSE